MQVFKKYGAEAGTRTPTGLRPLEPESSAYTNFATPAFIITTVIVARQGSFGKPNLYFPRPAARLSRSRKANPMPASSGHSAIIMSMFLPSNTRNAEKRPWA